MKGKPLSEGVCQRLAIAHRGQSRLSLSHSQSGLKKKKDSWNTQQNSTLTRFFVCVSRILHVDLRWVTLPANIMSHWQSLISHDQRTSTLFQCHWALVKKKKKEIYRLAIPTERQHANTAVSWDLQRQPPWRIITNINKQKMGAPSFLKLINGETHHCYLNLTGSVFSYV